MCNHIQWDRMKWMDIKKMRKDIIGCQDLNDNNKLIIIETCVINEPMVPYTMIVLVGTHSKVLKVNQPNWILIYIYIYERHCSTLDDC